MALNLKKLQTLWKNKDNINPEKKIWDRAKTIFDAFDNIPKQIDWSRFPDETAKSKGFQESNLQGNKKWIENYINDDIDETLREQARKVYKIIFNGLDGLDGLAHIESRDPRFRTTSEAANNSKYESFNTALSKGQRSNRDSWFFSYNFPWHIVQWLQDKTLIDGFFEDAVGNGDALNYKFTLKYLWMLKTEEVIPILSLQSFYNLRQVFLDLDSKFDEKFGINGSNWAQTLKVFTTKWPEISTALCKALTNEETLEKRQELAKFLFYVSLEDCDMKDAQTLLEHGNKAIILYGPPGTGKTYTANEIVKSMIGEDEKIISEQMKIVQFHPNYTYQDFIGGIFPKTENGTISYEVKSGAFKTFCDTAAKEPDKKFIFIIDEINRADLSAVFGELMYCLEYRGKEIDIPNFEEKFAIPENVYIIGTMNNTDKSLIGFDLALRRRFGFFKVPPNMNVLQSVTIHDDSEIPSDEFIARAKALNDSLKNTLGLNEDKQIGHAYFLKITDFCEKKDDSIMLTPYALEQLWVYHIEPLLEEYLGMEFESKQDQIASLKKAFSAPENKNP